MTLDTLVAIAMLVAAVWSIARQIAYELRYEREHRAFMERMREAIEQ